jgi:hypothetical protein
MRVLEGRQAPSPFPLPQKSGRGDRERFPTEEWERGQRALSHRRVGEGTEIDLSLGLMWER